MKIPKFKLPFSPLIILIPLVLLTYAYLETFWTEVKTYPVTNAKIPAAFNHLKIALLTDIHHGPDFSLDRVKNVVSQTNALKPDVILLGGDYVSADAKFITPVINALGGLKAPMGIYAVLGNHDHYEGAPETLIAMRNAGIKEIINHSINLTRDGAAIKLSGIDDLSDGIPNLMAALSKTKPSDYVILLSHQPDIAETLTPGQADLVLSGHTHGGQITLFGLWAPIVNSRYGQKYRTGMVKAPNTTVIISDGIGTFGLPLRFFARPQIVIVELETP